MKSGIEKQKEQNNTTSDFELPSEFKAKWDCVIKNGIIDAFGEWFEEQEKLVKMVQIVIGITEKMAEEEYRGRV